VLLRLAGGKGSPDAKARVETAYAAVGLGPDARAEEISPARFVLLERAFHAPCSGGSPE
jgi:hypothetical protein